jgi:hypothetical protein
MKLFRKLVVIFLVFLIVFIVIPRDINRHPVTGYIEKKYMDDGGTLHFVLVGSDRFYDIEQVPRIVYDSYREGDLVTITIRGNQYRYMGNVL